MSLLRMLWCSILWFLWSISTWGQFLYHWFKQLHTGRCCDILIIFQALLLSTIYIYVYFFGTKFKKIEKRVQEWNLPISMNLWNSDTLKVSIAEAHSHATTQILSQKRGRKRWNMCLCCRSSLILFSSRQRTKRKMAILYS